MILHSFHHSVEASFRQNQAISRMVVQHLGKRERSSRPDTPYHRKTAEKSCFESFILSFTVSSVTAHIDCNPLWIYTPLICFFKILTCFLIMFL